MYKLDLVKTTHVDKLNADVENKTTYSLNHCELSIFETHRKAENIKLKFPGFTVTSMLRGKKVLRQDTQRLAYIPGETLMLPSEQEMVIDFPDADAYNPTQCTALVIDNDYLRKQLEYINENFPRDHEYTNQWDLDPSQFFLKNDEKIMLLGNRLVKIFSGDDPMKDILVDIKLKELILSIIRLQNYKMAGFEEAAGGKFNERFKAVVQYIKKNVADCQITSKDLSELACMSKSGFYRAFTNEFGVPPNKMILLEKIKYAKQLMAADEVRIKEVCFASGFSDPNYFSRIFKKVEGLTPSEYLSQMKNNIQA